MRERLLRDLALEAIKFQQDTGGYFVFYDHEDSEMWSNDWWRNESECPSWYHFRERLDGGQFHGVTNSWSIAQEVSLRSPHHSEISQTSVAEEEVPHQSEINQTSDVEEEVPHQPIGGASFLVQTWSAEEAEVEASRLTEEHDFSLSACQRLLEHTPWPRNAHARQLSQENQNCQNHYYTFGLFSHGGVYGLTRLSRQKPHLLRYLNQFMTFHGALEARTSITINFGAHLAYHRDSNNLGANSVIGLGGYVGGKLWVEDGHGAVSRQVRPGVWKRGSLHSIKGKMLTFNPRAVRGPEPWTGRRWTITAYETRSIRKAPAELRRELHQAGFETRGYLPMSSTHPSGVSWSLLDAVQQELGGASACLSFPVTTEIEEDEGDDLEDVAAGHDSENAPESPLPQVSQAQKTLIRKLHINTGHPPTDRFLRTLKAAGALPHILKYVREEFACQDCQLRRGPAPRRRAQCPRTYGFNRALSVDVFYVRFNEQNIPFLNMVCCGTNYQVIQRVQGCGSGTPSASSCWQTFLHTWVRFLGAPALVICDNGSEFKKEFERGLEQLGTLQHVTIPDQPWQNTKAERHGGWAKEKLNKEINSGQCSFSTLQELDEFVSCLVAAKNRFFNHGGHTPTQLVFGELPRVPGELLSEDGPGIVPLADSYHDPTGLDEVGAEFRRRVDIRERARQSAMAQDSRKVVKKAMKTSTATSRQWRAGQWVYVFRRGKPGDPLHPVSRWVGPGLVLLSSPNLIWVAMRTRLWRCSPEQLRAAFPEEVLGRQIASEPGYGELLRRVLSGAQAGAINVAREGSPSEGDQLMPVDRDETGIPLAETTRGPEVPQAPQPAIPIPPGLHPLSQVEQLQGDPVQVRPPPGLRSHESSRRTSITVEEPAVEPDITTRLSPVPEEDPTGPEGLEPPSKVARTTEPVGAERRSGSPIGSILDMVRRGRQLASGSTDPVEISPDLEMENPNLEDTGEDLLTFDEDLSAWTYVASRSDEISLKDLSLEEQKLFEESDRVEWEAILQTKAVHVVVGAEAARLREKYSDRIVSSRMVRRKKPVPERLHGWKPKSRWCLHGHRDPDGGSLITYAPTPQAEGMNLFMQTGLNLGHCFVFGDVKNAFCQSDPLRRAKGPLFAEPCAGLCLPAGALIVIDVPVYGLDDAPAAWRATVARFLVEDMGFVRNLIEPCWYVKFDKAGRNVAQALVEVDDFIVSTAPAYQQSIKEAFTSRFHFGKWEPNEAEYAGRRIKVLPDRVLIDQEKYILEQLQPVPLAKGRRSDRSSALQEDEFRAFRSCIYRVNWIAKETRPEVSGLASIMASKLSSACVEDALTVNKAVNHLRNTASRPIILWKYDPSSMVFLAVSDAGGINSKGEELDEIGLPSDNTQGAWMVLAAEALPIGERRVKASPIAWRSSKLKRKVLSTFGGETQAMLQGINETDWLQVMYRDAVWGDVRLEDWRNSLSPHMVIMRDRCELSERQKQCSVTDAKSLFDCILKEHPQGRQDRKASLELAIIVRDLQQTKSMVRWAPHQKMLVDSLTKADPLKGNGAMEAFLKSGSFSLVDVATELANRSSDARFRRRSHAASAARLAQEYQDNYWSVLSTLIWGNCEACPVGVNLQPCDFDRTVQQSRDFQ